MAVSRSASGPAGKLRKELLSLQQVGRVTRLHVAQKGSQHLLPVLGGKAARGGREEILPEIVGASQPASQPAS